MNILITGASGLLGAHLMVLFARRHRVVGVDRHVWWGNEPAELILGDLSDSRVIANAVATANPQVVIHCAASVNVDACEKNPAEAYAANASVTRELARAAGPNCLVVYITTDGIFKGDQSFSTERDLPCPRTVYGRSKLHGEWEVQLATDRYLIVRTNFFGWSSGRKKTSAEWLYKALQNGEEITLFKDFYFSPIYVVDLVERLEVLVQHQWTGIFHICGQDRVSKYEFGSMLAKAAGFSMSAVRTGSIAEAQLAASRPKDMSLSSDRFRAETGMDVPDCKSSIERFVSHRETSLSKRFDPVDVAIR